jgi:hypothetical protein
VVVIVLFLARMLIVAPLLDLGLSVGIGEHLARPR